jgi:hypothetical protein
LSRTAIRTIELDPKIIRTALIAAQVLALLVYLMGAAFLLHTNGGTLFLFSLGAPFLILGSVVALAGVALYRYFRRQSLFAFARFEPGDILFQHGGLCRFCLFHSEG